MIVLTNPAGLIIDYYYYYYYYYYNYKPIGLKYTQRAKPAACAAMHMYLYGPM